MAENKYYGIYQGVVSNIKDPEKRGRIKITCPEVLGGSAESAWCDPCVPIAYDNGGDFCLPQVDETVWVMFQSGDSNKPVYMGGWWQKDKSPLGDNYEQLEDTRVISYADCQITMMGGKININIGAGTGDVIIEDNEITIRGNLKVTGSITASRVSAGALNAVAGKNGGGTVKVDDTLEVTGDTTLSKVTVKELEVENLSATGYVKANAVDLETHVHGGVTTGSDDTEAPKV